MQDILKFYPLVGPHPIPVYLKFESRSFRGGISEHLEIRLHTGINGGSDRVGGGIAPAVLPHHRAYGSVPRRFL